MDLSETHGSIRNTGIRTFIKNANVHVFIAFKTLNVYSNISQSQISVAYFKNPLSNKDFTSILVIVSCDNVFSSSEISSSHILHSHKEIHMVSVQAANQMLRKLDTASYKDISNSRVRSSCNF